MPDVPMSSLDGIRKLLADFRLRRDAFQTDQDVLSDLIECLKAIEAAYATKNVAELRVQIPLLANHVRKLSVKDFAFRNLWRRVIAWGSLVPFAIGVNEVADEVLLAHSETFAHLLEELQKAQVWQAKQTQTYEKVVSKLEMAEDLHQKYYALEQLLQRIQITTPNMAESESAIASAKPALSDLCDRLDGLLSEITAAHAQAGLYKFARLKQPEMRTIEKFAKSCRSTFDGEDCIKYHEVFMEADRVRGPLSVFLNNTNLLASERELNQEPKVQPKGPSCLANFSAEITPLVDRKYSKVYADIAASFDGVFSDTVQTRAALLFHLFGFVESARTHVILAKDGGAGDPIHQVKHFRDKMMHLVDSPQGRQRLFALLNKEKYQLVFENLWSVLSGVDAANVQQTAHDLSEISCELEAALSKSGGDNQHQDLLKDVVRMSFYAQYNLDNNSEHQADVNLFWLMMMGQTFRNIELSELEDNAFKRLLLAVIRDRGTLGHCLADGKETLSASTPSRLAEIDQALTEPGHGAAFKSPAIQQQRIQLNALLSEYAEIYFRFNQCATNIRYPQRRVTQRVAAELTETIEGVDKENAENLAQDLHQLAPKENVSPSKFSSAVRYLHLRGKFSPAKGAVTVPAWRAYQDFEEKLETTEVSSDLLRQLSAKVDSEDFRAFLQEQTASRLSGEVVADAVGKAVESHRLAESKIGRSPLFWQASPAGRELTAALVGHDNPGEFAALQTNLFGVA
jgi:hypothetical protein